MWVRFVSVSRRANHDQETMLLNALALVLVLNCMALMARLGM